jgi:hypothetical protein
VSAPGRVHSARVSPLVRSTLLAVALFGCKTTPSPARLDAAPAAPASAVKTGGRLVWGLFSGPIFEFELAYDGCSGQKDCPITLTLRSGPRILEQEVIAKSCGEFRGGPPDAAFNIAADTLVWTGNCQLNVGVRPVNLAKGEVALLLSEERGGEHPEVHHVLYRADKGKLLKAWEERRPATSPVELRVVPAASKYQDLAALYLERGQEGGAVTRLRAVRLRWDPAQPRLVESALPDADFHLGLLYLGPHRDQKAALAAPVGPADACDFRATLLSGQLFPGLGMKGVIAARVFVDLTEAERTRKALIERCPTQFTPKYLEYGPRPGGGFKPAAGPAGSPAAAPRRPPA